MPAGPKWGDVCQCSDGPLHPTAQVESVLHGYRRAKVWDYNGLAVVGRSPPLSSMAPPSRRIPLAPSCRAERRTVAQKCRWLRRGRSAKCCDSRPGTGGGRGATAALQRWMSGTAPWVLSCLICPRFIPEGHEWEGCINEKVGEMRSLIEVLAAIKASPLLQETWRGTHDKAEALHQS